MGGRKNCGKSENAFNGFPGLPNRLPGFPGATGATGATGASVGSIVPFNSGIIDLTATLGLGLSVGFGTSIPVIPVGLVAVLSSIPIFFDSPRAGTITALTTEFLATAILSAGVTLSVTLYTSPAGSAIWTVQEISTITLPPLAIGGVATGSTATTAIPIVLGTKVALAITSSGVLTSGAGTVGAGINII